MAEIDLSTVDLIAMDYGEKVRVLDALTTELLQKRSEFAAITGRYMELKANIDLLKNIKSALQSSIRAERAEM